MSLAKYTAKRTALLFPTLIGVSIVVFLLVKIVPGSPIVTMLPPESQTPTQIAQLRQRLGLNEPIYIQYGKWFWNALHGNLGESYASGQPVFGLIVTTAWRTAQLSIVALLVALFIAIPAGVLSAVYENTWIDYLSRLFAFSGISIPSFWLGIMVILLFALYSEIWFGFQMIPAGGYVPPRAGLFLWLRHALAPGIVLGIGFSALITRLTRASMLEILDKDFITTARANGVKEMTIMMIHALRNALIPVVTVIGYQIGFLLNGSIVVEQVFQWPGIGRLLFRAVTERDMPVIQGIVLFIGFIFIFVNYMVDLTYAYLDPRIQYEEGGQ